MCHAQVEWSTTSGGPYTNIATGMARAYIQVQGLFTNNMASHCRLLDVEACSCKPYLLYVCLSFGLGHHALCLSGLFLFAHAQLPAELMRP